MNDFIKMLDEWFGQKAPKLPVKAKEVIVKIAPYLAIISVIFAIPAVLLILGFGAGFGYYGGYGMTRYGGMMGGGYVGAIFSIAIIVLYAMAIPGLLHRKASGWTYSFYAVLVGGVQNLLSFNLGGLIIGLALGFYILFQIKAYYFGGATISTPPAAPPQNPPQKPQV